MSIFDNMMMNNKYPKQTNKKSTKQSSLYPEESPKSAAGKQTFKEEFSDDLVSDYQDMESILFKSRGYSSRSFPKLRVRSIIQACWQNAVLRMYAGYLATAVIRIGKTYQQCTIQ